MTTTRGRDAPRPATELRAGALAVVPEFAVSPRARVETVLAAAEQRDERYVVVVHGRRIVGGLVEEHLRNAVRLGLGAFPVADLLTEAPPRVSPRCGPDELRRRLADPNRPFVVLSGGAVGRERIVPRAALGRSWIARAPRVARPGVTARLGATALRILRCAGEAGDRRGLGVYLVGGAVRDLVLRRRVVDLDLVVEGSAPALARDLVRQLGGRATKHPAFGTASVELPEGAGRVDLASARVERYVAAGALPETSKAPLDADLLRRDFTVNCLAVDLSVDRFGEWIDPCDGYRDAREGAIRVLHGLSFVEDPTRIFRAARFELRLGFESTRHTARLIRVARRAGLVERLSAARLRREIVALLSGPGIARATRVMGRYRLWDRLDREWRPGRTAVRRLARLEAVLAAVGTTREPVWALALALLLFDEPAHRRKRCLARLSPDRRSAAILRDAAREARSLSRRLVAAPLPGPGGIRAACRRCPDSAVMVAAAVTRRPSLRNAFVSYLTRWRDVRAEISGTDLLRAGVPPGPAIAAGLEAAVRAKLDGRATDRAGQLEIALRTARRRARGRRG